MRPAPSAGGNEKCRRINIYEERRKARLVCASCDCFAALIAGPAKDLATRLVYIKFIPYTADTAWNPKGKIFSRMCVARGFSKPVDLVPSGFALGFNINRINRWSTASIEGRDVIGHPRDDRSRLLSDQSSYTGDMCIY